MAAAIIACTGTLFFGSLLQSAVAQDTANLPYMNPKLSPEQRAADLVRRMTLAEKATLYCGFNYAIDAKPYGRSLSIRSVLQSACGPRR
jgi:hypothetical protein